MRKMSKKITILWGTNKEDKKSYEFKTDEQLKYFMMGVDEANGWLEYEIEEDEQKTRRAKFKSFNKSQPLAPGTRAKLQAASNKLQASGRKLDKKTI